MFILPAKRAEWTHNVYYMSFFGIFPHKELLPEQATQHRAV